MTRIRCLAAIILAIAFTADACAQFLPVIIPNGIDFRYKSGHLRVRGFIPTGGATILVPGGPFYYPYAPYALGSPFPPWGVVEQRISVQVLPPASIPLREGYPRMPDITGIDLDVEPPSKIWGNPPANAKIQPEPKKIEIARVEPKPEKKIEIERKPEPKPNGERLLELGIDAFKAGEYAIAHRRFRQAVDEAPAPPRAVFYLAQASIAVGKYGEAARLIREGVELQKNWPANAFRPRLDLYGDAADFAAHRKQLEAALKVDAKNADRLFLLGYLAWFNGERDAAVEHFQQSRAVAGDALAIDLFLRVAKKN